MELSKGEGKVLPHLMEGGKGGVKSSFFYLNLLCLYCVLYSPPLTASHFLGFNNICDFAMFSCPNVYPHKIGTLRVTLIELHSNKIK